MPATGARILFWIAAKIDGEDPGLSAAARIDAIRARLVRLRATLEQAEQRILAGALGAQDMQAEHDALSGLLDQGHVLDTQIRTLRASLSARPEAFLSGWRVTRCEIMATDARALQHQLNDLLRRIKQCQVDISGRLLDAV